MDLGAEIAPLFFVVGFFRREAGPYFRHGDDGIGEVQVLAVVGHAQRDPAVVAILDLAGIAFLGEFLGHVFQGRAGHIGDETQHVARRGIMTMLRMRRCQVSDCGRTGPRLVRR